MTAQFSSKKRSEWIKELDGATVDVLIIGGGITGSGIALDTATRGLSTALVEMQDFAAGTSSRSTKLVHGGLRYLKQFEVGLVAEVGKEREIVYENGPHVTTPEWMLLPIHQGGTFGLFSTSIGLRVYDFLAGVKRSERRKMLSAQETLQKAPLVKKEGLKGGGYYVEYRTDDARLTIEVLKQAVKNGAKAFNYTKVEELIYKDGQAIGAKVKDLISGTEHHLYAKKIVNAAGPWVDNVRELDQSRKGKMLKLSKGVHLVIDQKRFPLQQAVYFDTPDGRMVFAIPRDGKTYVGTTDTFYEGDARNPKMTEEDRQYIMNAIRYMFPDLDLTIDDVESSWAGVRPLIYEEGKDPSEISRKDEIWESPSGLISIAGGKLTGYRKMAEMVVDLLVKKLQKENKWSQAIPACQTKHLPISGGDVGGSKGFPGYVAQKTAEAVRFGFTREQGERLVRLYGSNIDELFSLTAMSGNENTFGLPLDIFVSLVYSLEAEMVVKPEDFFIRRTGALFFNLEWVKQWKEQVCQCMAHYLGWSEEQKESYKKHLEEHMHYAVEPSSTDY